MLRSRRAWATAPALVTAVCLASPPARALTGEPEVEVVSVAYSGEDMCPSRERFIQNVQRYTTKWRVAASSSSIRNFRLVLQARGAEHRGTLIVETPDGKATRREIVAPDCERVARGLAVAMALAIDPEANIAEIAPREAPAPQSTGAAPSPPPPPPSSAVAVKPAPVAAPSRRSALTFAVEGRLELTSALTATAVPLIGAAFEVRAALDGLPVWLAPSLAIGVRQSWPTVVDAPSGSSEFWWTAATFRLCPVRILLASNRLDAAPCAEANAGVLQAEAQGIPDARSTASGWFDLGGSLRVVYRIGKAWGIGATALATAPFVRHRFALVGGELISQAPAVGITGGLLVELRL